ncbi:MAG: hypothetical protein AVDCRST_MAG39-2743 [uncultured Sphingomonadaceae bacterium]|uniref:Uncharacterized protein n=1 Tax=uncultured Sphingomonadaceae bacterium TaxID=169976 RepID=A0A6J4TJV7_9SPHN|nr:MAG: hypothetical protein AVDCRST_MAG39-2743 [uncultured Sphingomonadaceae bacterium]
MSATGRKRTWAGANKYRLFGRSEATKQDGACDDLPGATLFMAGLLATLPEAEREALVARVRELPGK